MPPLPPMTKRTMTPISPRYSAPVTPSHDDFPEIGFALSDPPPENDWLIDDSKDRIQTTLESSPSPPDADKKGVATQDAQLKRDEAVVPVPVAEKKVESSMVESSMVESSMEGAKTSKTSGKKTVSSEYPGYVDLNSCRLGDAIDALISVPIIILQVIWINMEDQESTEGSIMYWSAAGMEIYLLIELWGYVLIGEVTPMSLLSIYLIRKARSHFTITFMPFPDIIRKISRFLLGLSLIANTILSFWPGVNDYIPLSLSIQLWLALMASAGMNQ